MASRSLTYSPLAASSADAPPKDTYVLELVTIGQFEEKPAFKQSPDDPTYTNIQCRVTFKIVDFEYDPEFDEKDWNGATVSDFWTFFKRYPDEEEDRETWRSDRSNAFKLISALLGHELEEGEDVDLDAFAGTRIKATVEPKPSGWPKISNPVPYRRKRSTPKPEAEDLGPFTQAKAA